MIPETNSNEEFYPCLLPNTYILKTDMIIKVNTESPASQDNT